MTKVLCVGTAVVDFVFHFDSFPDQPEKYATEKSQVVGGGIAANAAVAIARLGGQAILGARLGDDSIGDLISADLAAEGVDVDRVTRTNGALSSYSSVYIDSSGERQIVNFRGQGLELDTSWISDIADLKAVLVDTRQVPAALAALELAKSQCIPGIVDGEAPIDPAILHAASHAGFSLQGLRSLCPAGDIADALTQAAETYDIWACVTDGANGVWHTGPNGISHEPAFAISPDDTLGAGDVWHGAFALALAESLSETAAIRFANGAAALKCMTLGGRSGTPNRSQLDEFLKEKSR